MNKVLESGRGRTKPYTFISKCIGIVARFRGLWRYKYKLLNVSCDKCREWGTVQYYHPCESCVIFSNFNREYTIKSLIADLRLRLRGVML